MAGEIETFRQGFTVGQIGIDANGRPRHSGFNSLRFMRFRKSKAALSGRTKVAFIGDSTFFGYVTPAQTTAVARSIPSQCAAKLQARGINASAHNRFGAQGAWSSLLTFDGRVTSTGAWSQTGTLVVGGNAFGASATGSMTFAPTGNVDTFDIYWINNAIGRTFTYAVDGGSTTDVSTTGVYAIAKTTVSAGSLGTHTLTLAQKTLSCNIIGIDAYDSTRKEIAFYNWGLSGARSDQLIDNTDTVVGRLAGYSYFAPSLAIVEGGVINSWRQSRSLVNTKADLTTLVSTLKTNSDVLLYTPRFDNGTAGASASQEDYVNLMYEVADEQDVDIFDARSSFGSWAIGNAAGFYSDDVHGDVNGIGYGDEAEALVNKFLLSV